MEMFDLSSLSPSNLYSGGMSGLHLIEKMGDELVFYSHSDRGPNGEVIETLPDGTQKRPFLYPEFQPHWVKFSLNQKTREIKNLGFIHLTNSAGKPLNGLPNKAGDELAIDTQGNELKKDINGIDPEALCADGQNVWMGEEYGPSILKFNHQGQLIKRYIPEGSYSDVTDPSYVRKLPSYLTKKKLNRGFEGIACMNNKVYAILQSPLKGDGLDVRILEFNPQTESVEKVYLYPLDSKQADKIGDMAVLNDALYVLEQNSETGPQSIHNVFKVRLDSVDAQGKLKKELVLDLVRAGYHFAEKIEGLSVISENELAVINDNDFGVNNPLMKSILGIFKIK